MDASRITHPFAAYTTAEIKAFILAGYGRSGMIAELRRRAAEKATDGWPVLPDYDVERAKHY